LRYENLGPITRSKAARLLAQRVASAGTPAKVPVQVTFDELADSWQAQVLPMYKDSTQKNHRHILAKHLVPRFGETQLAELGRQHVQAYVADLLRHGYAPKTIDHIHDVLSAVLRTAVKWGYLTENPARQVELPALRTVRPKWVLTEAQAAALVAALPPLAKTLAGLAMVTGLRRGEIFALRWKDLGPNDEAVIVDEAVYEGHFNTPKTAAGLRRIPLSPVARHLVGAWRGRAKRTGPDDLMFATWSGKPIAPNNVLRSAIFPTCERLALPRATWLTFRRTYASWAHDTGIAGRTIATLMGHAKVDTTLNVYAQVLDASVRDAAERVGNGLITIVHNTGSAETLTH
jgi:integrase